MGCFSLPQGLLQVRWVSRHVVKFFEILTGHGHHLCIGRVVAGDAVHHVHVGMVLFAPVTEFVARFTWTRDQHFVRAFECFGNVGIQVRCVAGLALVFVVGA